MGHLCDGKPKVPLLRVLGSMSPFGSSVSLWGLYFAAVCSRCDRQSVVLCSQPTRWSVQLGTATHAGKETCTRISLTAPPIVMHVQGRGVCCRPFQAALLVVSDVCPLNLAGAHHGLLPDRGCACALSHRHGHPHTLRAGPCQ